MRAIVATGFSFGALFAASACSSILGISDRSLEWCLQPANAHDFCEDFDHANPIGAWSFAPAPMTGATRTFVPSDYDPPNAQAMDTLDGPLAPNVSSLNGLEQSFTSQTFGKVDVGVDIRILQTNFSEVDGFSTGAGFLLLSDVPTTTGSPECIGFVLAPTSAPSQIGIGVLLVPDSPDCLTVSNTQDDAGSMPTDTSDAGTAATGANPTPSLLANVFVNQWFRLSLTVTRLSDGSGTIDFRVPSGSSNAPPSIPVGSLAPGYPTLAIGTDVTGPSGIFELQFDNVTVDFSPSPN